MHQWYKINVNEIVESHTLALCDDQSTHMVPLPPAKLPEINTFAAITRLTFLQTQDEPVNNSHKQPMHSVQNTNISLQSQNIHPPQPIHCYLTAIQHDNTRTAQFHKVFSNINKITEACTEAQENTSKLIESAISQALAKPQDPARDSRAFEANCESNSSYDTNWTMSR